MSRPSSVLLYLPSKLSIIFPTRKIVTTISDKLITIAQLQLTITKLFYINDYSIIEARYYIIQNIFANILFKHRGTRYVPFHEFSMKQGFIRVKGSFEQSTPLPPPCRRSWALIFHPPSPPPSPASSFPVATRNVGSSQYLICPSLCKVGRRPCSTKICM